jgi:hypothetical protein
MSLPRKQRTKRNSDLCDSQLLSISSRKEEKKGNRRVGEIRSIYPEGTSGWRWRFFLVAVPQICRIETSLFLRVPGRWSTLHGTDSRISSYRTRILPDADRYSRLILE